MANNPVVSQIEIANILYDIKDAEARDSIPKNLSDLKEDTSHRTVTDEEKEKWNVLQVIDSELKEGSKNPVENNAVATKIGLMQDSITFAKTQATIAKDKVNDLINGKETADKATKDAKGNVISETYLRKDEVVKCDNALSDTSINPVQNKVITTEIKQDRNNFANTVIINLLKPSYDNTIVNGITIVDNKDGSFTLNGTATIATTFILQNNIIPSEGLYRLVGCPAGGSYGKYGLWASNQYTSVNGDFGEGAALSFDGRTSVSLAIVVWANATLANVTFKPMLTFYLPGLNITIDNFVPYTGDEPTLNKAVSAIYKKLNIPIMTVAQKGIGSPDGETILVDNGVFRINSEVTNKVIDYTSTEVNLNNLNDIQYTYLITSNALNIPTNFKIGYLKIYKDISNLYQFVYCIDDQLEFKRSSSNNGKSWGGWQQFNLPDSTLNTSSTKPIQNKVVASEIDKIKNGNTIVKKAEQDSDGNIIKDTYLKKTEKINCDDTLSGTSTNPVQNKIITSEINNIKSNYVKKNENNAEGVSYNSTSSQIEADNVQAAIDYLATHQGEKLPDNIALLADEEIEVQLPLVQELPFGFGIDDNGNYGYYKKDSEILTPFAEGGGAGLPEIYIGNDPSTADDNYTFFIDTSENYGSGSGNEPSNNGFPNLEPIFLGKDYVEQTDYNTDKISVSITLPNDCSDIFFIAGITDCDNNNDNYFQNIIADNMFMIETKRVFQSTSISNPFTQYLNLFSSLLNTTEILSIPQRQSYFTFVWKYYLKEGKAGESFTFTKQYYGRDVFVFAYALNQNGKVLSFKMLI